MKGPDVCYDCPAKIMYQQFGFFKFAMEGQKFETYTRIIQQEVEEYFTTKWGDNGTQCLFTALSECFTLTSAHCLLGMEIRSQWNGEFASFYRDLDHSFIPITFFYPNMPHPFKSKCVRARQKFEEMFKSVMAQRKANGEVHDDFLQILMDARYKDDRALTVQEITGIMVGVLLGGQHTSNVTGTWMMCHLMHDDKWRNIIMDEQRELLKGDLSRPLDWDDVTKMQKFEMALDETLRLHPPFFQLARKVMADTPFKGRVIPRGHMVAISPGAAQRLPELWGENPERFDPDRWAEDKVKEQPKYAYIPFGGGRHICSGRKFAISSLKIALTWLLKNYKLEFAHPVPKDDYTTMVVAPQAPVLFKYQRIKY